MSTIDTTRTAVMAAADRAIEEAVDRGDIAPEAAIRVLLAIEATTEDPEDPMTCGAPLSPREREVLDLMRMGLSYKEISMYLTISWHTVRTHAQAVLRKLGVHSRFDLRTPQVQALLDAAHTRWTVHPKDAA